MLFANLTRTRIGELAPRATVVIPVGATEQHGPHLPVDVDAFIVGSVARAAAERAASEAEVLVCPVVPFGASGHHLVFPGVLSLTSDTLLRVLRDLTDSLVAGGFRRIFILNGHGGNDEAIRLAARELALRHDVIAGAASYWTLAWSSLMGQGQALEVGRVPGHAGGFETSIMLALDPDSVRRELLPLPRQGRGVRSTADPAARPAVHRHGSWAATDGYSDDGADASAERGRELFDIIVHEVADEFLRFHHLADGTEANPGRGARE